MRLIPTLLLGLLLLSLPSCTKKDTPRLQYDAAHLSVTLTGPRYQGDFYPFPPLRVPTDYAIWIEDASRRYVRTLEITQVAVSVGDEGSHLEHLPSWMASSGVTYATLQRQTDAGIAPAFDGITSASPFFWAAMV